MERMMETYDIAAANQRQSDLLRGWDDAHDRKPMRTDISEAYVRGYQAYPAIRNRQPKVQS